MAQPKTKPKAKPAEPEGIVDTLVAKGKQFVSDFQGIWKTSPPPTGVPQPRSLGMGGPAANPRAQGIADYMSEATGQEFAPAIEKKKKK